MYYTPDHYAMLERFEHGLNIDTLSENELDTYQFLMQQNLLQPRYDLEDGLNYLSEPGKCVLAEHRDNLQKINQEADELAKKATAEKKSKSSDRFHDFLILILGAAITFILDHISEIIKLIRGLLG